MENVLTSSSKETYNELGYKFQDFDYTMIEHHWGLSVK